MYLAYILAYPLALIKQYYHWVTFRSFIISRSVYHSISLICCILEYFKRMAESFVLIFEFGTLCPFSEIVLHDSCSTNVFLCESNKPGKTGGTETQNTGGSNTSLDSESPSPDKNHEAIPSENEFKSLGSISLDFSQISSGLVVIMVGRFPLLSINLFWVLSHLSRSSRKSLAKWLQQKNLGETPWPMLQNPHAQSEIISGGIKETPVVEKESSEKTTVATLPNGAAISPAFLAFIMKLLKSGCGLSSMNHSNSIFDSLRIWITKHSPLLYVKSSRGGGYLDPVKLDSVVTTLVSDLKNRRATSKSKSSGNKKPSVSDKVVSPRTSSGNKNPSRRSSTR